MDMETRDRITTLVQRLEYAENMLFIIHIAVDRDIFDAKAFAPALYGTYEYLTMQTEGLRALCRTAGDGTDRGTVPEGQ